MNNYPEDGEFTHEIIIPESDVLAEGYPVRFKEERIEELLGFSKRIWQFPPVRAIQTGLKLRMTQPALRNWHREDSRTPGLLLSWRTQGLAMKIPYMISSP